MRWSRAFLPVLKESPADAQIVSHKLMLRAGLVRQTAAGIYAWLPLGFRVLKKIEQIVREEQDRAGAQELLMPTLQSAELWRESGRYDAYGPEMLRIRDRHDREMLYGPTNEEMLTAIVRDELKSYRELPRTLYHIQWKFRDEVRPRFGVMRGREFLMKDAYSFDLDEAGARQSYYTQLLAYLRTFQRLGIQAVPMRRSLTPLLIGIAIGATPVMAQAPQPAALGCKSPEHRQFDFWVGTWDVSPTGQDRVVARSVVENLYGGCVIRENWMPAAGTAGGSLNTFDPADNRWHQVWMDASNARVLFDGGMIDGGMFVERVGQLHQKHAALPGLSLVGRQHLVEDPEGHLMLGGKDVVPVASISFETLHHEASRGGGHAEIVAG